MVTMKLGPFQGNLPGSSCSVFFPAPYNLQYSLESLAIFLGRIVTKDIFDLEDIRVKEVDIKFKKKTL